MSLFINLSLDLLGYMVLPLLVIFLVYKVNKAGYLEVVDAKYDTDYYWAIVMVIAFGSIYSFILITPNNAVALATIFFSPTLSSLLFAVLELSKNLEKKLATYH